MDAEFIISSKVDQLPFTVMELGQQFSQSENVKRQFSLWKISKTISNLREKMAIYGIL